MLARIRFTTSELNRLTWSEVERLENFLGEKVKTSQMKIDGGEISRVSWKETFDKDKVEKDSDYKLVTPTDMYLIDDSTTTYLVSLEKFTNEFPNLEISIRGVPKAISEDHNNLIEMMNKVADKIEDAKNRFDKVVEYNQKCEVHVPGLGLLNINKVAYATDYCTEELQRLLHQGWRLLAICPQPDQRRPDYILGMNVSKIDEDVKVEHFSGNGNEKD